MNPTFAERKMVVTLEPVPEKSSTKVFLSYPALVKSTCRVDVTNFPFDRQVNDQLRQRSEIKKGSNPTPAPNFCNFSQISKFRFQFNPNQVTIPPPTPHDPISSLLLAIVRHKALLYLKDRFPLFLFYIHLIQYIPYVYLIYPRQSYF